MSELRVSLRVPGAGSWRVPASVRGLDSTEAHDLVLTSNAAPTRLPVPPGRYLVEAWLPSGEPLRRGAEVRGEPPVDVALVAAGSPHEWLATAARVSPRNRFRPTVDRPVGPEGAARVDERVVANPFAALGRALGGLPPGGDPLPPGPSAGTLAHFLLPPLPGAAPPQPGAPLPPGRLVVARRGAEARAVALPGLWLTAHGQAAPFDLVLDVATGALSTTVDDPDFAPVLGYLAAGQGGLAARALHEHAVEILAAKLLNPYAAAAGGYVLLGQTRRGRPTSGRWQDWIHNLARWFPGLPDAAVLLGTQILHGLGTDHDPGDATQRARACFERALDAGVPLFSAGVRWLLDGALAVGLDGPRLARVRRLALQVDPEEPFTTLRIGGAV